MTITIPTDNGSLRLTDLNLDNPNFVNMEFGGEYMTVGLDDLMSALAAFEVARRRQHEFNRENHND